jgi:hypothetical protein
MPKSNASRCDVLNPKAGEWVEVRSREEILATLGKNGCLENLPFMPEMFAFCGQRAGNGQWRSLPLRLSAR